MNKKEEKRKGEALYKMGLAYDREMSKMQIAVYLESLLPYSVEQVERAVQTAIKTHEMGLPKVATLIKILTEQDPQYVSEEQLKLAAEAEWAKLRQAVPRIGAYRTPTFRDKTTEAVVRMMGGWSAQCDMYEDEKPFRRKEFIELWTQVRGKEIEIAQGAEGVLGGKMDTAIGNDQRAIGGKQYALQ